MGGRGRPLQGGIMTATAMPLTSAPSRTGAARSYGRFWRRMPRELGYLAVTTVIGVLSLTALRGVESVGASLLVVLVGLIVFALLLIATRYLGLFELYRLRLARLPEIPAPVWSRPFAGKGFFRALGDVFANPHSWLYYLHSGVLNPILALLTTIVWLPWTIVALTSVSMPAWGFLSPFRPGAHLTFGRDGAPVDVHGWTLAQVSAYSLTGSTSPSSVAGLMVGVTALGLAMIAVFPFVTRGLSMAHWGLARLLLARFRSEQLGVEVERVGAAQRAAVAAEDNALRRLERDIHDGPQQRLLRLQMELAAAERHLPADAAASESIAEARTLAQEALDELRALAQGFAPPLLQDRGLRAALEALARRSAVPIDADIRLDAPLPSPIERSAYFVAAELTSNAIKHAAARHVTLVAVTDPPAVTGGAASLRISVTDDGVGGAVTVRSTGWRAPPNGSPGWAARCGCRVPRAARPR